ncbi:MAG: NFACT family protein [Oscillospiraceae bacterium]|nr:NFACT family protein [Oscillospiraceae bacterium]
MPTDGLTLGFLARECDDALRGGRVERVQQPDRSSILLIIRSRSENYRLLLSADTNAPRIQLTAQTPPNPQEPPMFCMLLRKRLQGAKITGVRQIRGDRVIWVYFETQDDLGEPGAHHLIAECTGRNSNLILTDASGRIVDAVRHVNASMSRYREVLPGRLYQPPPEQDKLEPFTAEAADIASRFAVGGGKLSRCISDAIAGIGPASARELAYRAVGDAGAYIDSIDRLAAADSLCELLRRIPDLAEPTLLLNENGTPIDAFAFVQASLPAALQRPCQSLSEAMDACYAGRDARERMSRRTQALRKTLDNAIERAEKKLAIQSEAIARQDEIERLQNLGELITANLYRIPKGAASVTLEDYHLPDSPPALVPLDEQLTPAANAQRFFKQARKLRAASNAAAEQKRATEDTLLFLTTQRLDLDNCTDESELEEVRAQLIRAGVVRQDASRKKARKLPPSKPYKFRSSDGIDILVGKTSAQNDRLTADANGEETWLHAKDMPGSHVIIRHIGEPPAATLREALMLAAWYSKGRGSSNVPVDFTLRKHVKKPGGSPPGFVIYTHQRTRTVTPDERAVQALTPPDKI